MTRRARRYPGALVVLTAISVAAFLVSVLGILSIISPHIEQSVPTASTPSLLAGAMSFAFLFIAAFASMQVAKLSHGEGVIR